MVGERGRTKNKNKMNILVWLTIQVNLKKWCGNMYGTSVEANGKWALSDATANGH